jgi:arylsulfatase A-like enzyme
MEGRLPQCPQASEAVVNALIRILLVLLGSLPLAAAAPSKGRPNIVFILADDLGYTDLGCQGSRFYETPHIDRLARQGLRFTRYYTCPNCQPTRAALLSGQLGPRTGIYTVGHMDRFDWWKRPLRPVDNITRLPLDRPTFADALRKAGYATALFGKWHLGEDDAHHPSRRGFDEAIVSAGEHFDFRTHPSVSYPRGTYLADFLTDRAVDFIHRHKDRPFLLYLPHFGVHAPHQAKPDLIARFRRKTAAGGHRDPTYAAMIASVDESVGRVLAALDRNGLSDNTVVVFSSDNGGVGGYVREGLKQAGDVTDNAPLRSGKGSLHDGGIRAPFIVRWPGNTPAGATNDTPILHVDFFPTLLELAHAGAPGNTLDGQSLVPLFRGQAMTLARAAIFHHFPGYLGAGPGAWRTTPVGVVHSGDWKLMEFYEDGHLELYNLREDVGETRNLAATEPQRAQSLHSELVAWRTRIGARMPSPHTAGVRPDDFGSRPDRGE